MISICIPTFNRAQTVLDCVKNILLYDAADIEVVVCDNCSTDNTKELLQQIQDVRFSYFRNSQNIGYRNSHESLKYAKGEYCILCSDEDDILYDQLAEIITILKERPNIGIVLPDYSEETNIERGFYGVYQMAFLSRGYMTGMIFHKDSIRQIEDKINVESLWYQMFPHLYIGCLIACNKDILLSNKKIAEYGSRNHNIGCDRVAQKANKYGTHWMPAARKAQAESKLQLLGSLELSKKQKIKIAEKTLEETVHECTVGYYQMIQKLELPELMKKWNIPELFYESIDKDKHKTKWNWYCKTIKYYFEISRAIEKKYLKESFYKTLILQPSCIFLHIKTMIKIIIVSIQKIH